MKRFLFIISMLSLALCGRAQDLAMAAHGPSQPATAAPGAAVAKQPEPAFTFEVWGPVPDVENPMPEKHFLGSEVTRKWNTFLKNYSRQYAVSVGFTDSGYETLKPAVYHAVMRANRYVRKQVRQQLMSRADAVALMDHVLDCANTVVFESGTEQLEAAADHAATGKAAVDFFNSVRLVHHRLP